MGNLMNNSVPNEKNKLESLRKIDSLLNKHYLHEIEERYGLLNFSDYNKIVNTENDGPKNKISYESNVRALQVERWVFDREEQNIDKFKNILNVFAGEDTNLAFLVKRDKKGTSLYFILKNETNGEEAKTDASNNNAELLMNAITGNFNGTCIKKTSPKKIFIDYMEQIVSISCLTNIPSEKSERFISQSLDKLLDGIRPEKDDDVYYILIIAEPLTFAQIQDIQNGYEELASAIVPHAGYQFSIGKNENKSEGTMESLTNSENIFSSVTKTHGVSFGISGGIDIYEIGNVGANVGYNYSYSKTKGEGTGKAETTGKNYNLSVGTTENTTYNYQSYAIKALLEKLQMQLERINSGRSLGLWKCASYILANSPIMAINVANYLKSLTQGDESYIEPPIINTWNNSPEDQYFSNIKQYLLNFTHPIFYKEEDKEFITPTYNLTTNELSDIMVFPRKSVSGLPVLECASFGREVVTFSGYQGDIPLGKSFHMYKEEKHQSIMLNKESLKAHTFITGSTGSGKSNTVYKLLSEIIKNGAKFLVIEPAKGEYKDIFGNMDGVFVYGTNPEMSPLLRINPFAFNDGIHILEHLDRLVEIFNVCWPMYAAMPAVLKDAIEISYKIAGWNLITSKNKFPQNLYPTFTDVADNIRKIIDSSEYSDENKGNYKGALITRLKSLSNGINGLIFVNEEIGNDELFEENVIVDLSRVGSVETKALMMGIIVMKLQEHRMISGVMNSNLRHITVLEEAHNLLKRTSSEQTGESANLIGKSVEMMANAIAEMRTYGEGFIIADQSPGLLDMSVIRNTNTKIIMRLPDESDRQLVGKAAGLNDTQITELARLQCGVAAVYQNDWIQPVLCKVALYFEETKGMPYKYDSNHVYETLTDDSEFIALKKRLTLYLLSNMIQDPPKENIDSLKEAVMRSELKTGLKAKITDFIDSDRIPPTDINGISDMVAGLYDYSESALEKLDKIGANNIDIIWAKTLFDEVRPSIIDFTEQTQIIVMNCIITEISRLKISFRDLPKKWAGL